MRKFNCDTHTIRIIRVCPPPPDFIWHCSQSDISAIVRKLVNFQYYTVSALEYRVNSTMSITQCKFINNLTQHSSMTHYYWHRIPKSTKILREAFKKENGQIWEFVPIGWVGLHPHPNFLTGFNALKHIINS